MRTLLAADPFLPYEAREAIAAEAAHARAELVRLGANDCEARELLDELAAAGEGYLPFDGCG